MMKSISLIFIVLVFLAGIWAIYKKTESHKLDGHFVLKNELTLSDFKLSKKYGNFSISSAVTVNSDTSRVLDFRCLKESFGLPVSGPYGENPKASGEFTKMSIDATSNKTKRIFWPIIFPENEHETNIDSVLNKISADFSVWISDECVERLLKSK